MTEQLLLVPLGEPNAHVELVNVPPPDVEKVTVPSGAVAPVPEMSVTVAVHDVAVPCAKEPGRQLTVVDVDRAVTVNAPAPVPMPASGLVMVTSRGPVVALPPMVTLAVRWVESTKLVELTAMPKPEKV